MGCIAKPFDALPKKTTRTALYAAVAAKTSCRRAFVKIEQESENTNVNRKTVTICRLVLMWKSSGDVGISLKSTATGRSSKTAATSVRTMRTSMSSRSAERS